LHSHAHKHQDVYIHVIWSGLLAMMEVKDRDDASSFCLLGS